VKQPGQVVDVPQIEYEDKVVEVPVQKHVQASLNARVVSYFMAS